MMCEKCGQTLTIGEFPFCPHGLATPQIISDEYAGGFVQEHFGHEPETFYSKKAMYQRADELNLRSASPGELKRGHRPITSKTLDDARVLLSRGSQTTETVRCETASFTVRPID